MITIVPRLFTDAPLIEDGAFAALLHRVKSFDFQSAEPVIFKQVRERLKPQMTVRDDGIAIIPVEGVLARKPDVLDLFFGVEDSQNVLEMVESAARNNDIKGVLLNVDSPGGFLTGGPEIADAVKQTRKSKPVVTWTGGLAASLAYWIGSQADEVVSSRSAIVGSIGVFATHIDYSKFLEANGVKVEVIKNKEGDFKAAGAFGTALTAEQRANIQERIQASFREFKRAVTSARSDLADEAMRGQTFSGSEAKSMKLVDRIGDISYAISVLRSRMRSVR